MKVTVLFVNNKTWYSALGAWLIRYIEGTGFSHTAVQIEYKEASYVYHAVYPTFKRESLSSFRTKYSLFKKYDFEIDADPLVIYNYLQTFTGRKYSVAQLLLIYLRRTSAIINKISNGWILNHDNHLICSEFNAMFLQDFKDYKFTMKLDSVGLREIEKACEELK